MNSTPYIKLLKTPLGKYFYDVNKNDVVNISDELYEYLDTHGRNGELSETTAEEMEALKNNGYLSSHRVKKIKHHLTDKIEDYLERKCSKLTLQLTQNCNFRCSYCPYSTAEFYTNRSHSSKRMSEEVAIKAIDFYADHSYSKQAVMIGFYGGEPLLEFPLIKKLVAYAEDVFIGKKLSFSITTNGSLLTEEIMSFFEEHNFEAVISIDGSKKVHDRNRKFAATGKGTYDTIVNNIEGLYDSHKDYINNKVLINSVMDPRLPAQEYYSLQDKNEMFRNVSIRRTIVDDFTNTGKHAIDDSFIEENTILAFKALMSMINRYPMEKADSNIIQDELVEKRTADTYVKPRKEVPDTAAPAGVCVPGSKLFIDVDGNIHICEKVSETSKAFVLGNIYDGFDYEQIKKLLNIGALTAEKCRNCFAFSLCSICQRFCNAGDELSAAAKTEYCEWSKNYALHVFYNKIFYSELGGMFNKGGEV
ncbi:radical SAM protein [uncultured Ruminococcus sp.]|uniref:radical SAM protein n=1 Tax=uncultured Ruminococcus sp. TaxID=165186 RepID=UPI00260FE657|nr:radical SAM protein [uncultured Ruminococcus sp.]